MIGPPTRREVLAGALAGAAVVPGVARASASPGPLQARQEILRGGRAIAAGRGGRVVVAHERRRTISVITRGRPKLVDVGGQPLEVAVSPDGRLAAVTTASWDEPGLVLVDLVAGTVRKRVDAGHAPFGVAFTPRGDRVLVTGGEQEGTLRVLATESLKTVSSEQIGLVPRAVVAVAGGRSAWVALHGDGAVARVSLRSGRVTRTIETHDLPDRLALSPDGRRLLVSHGGHGVEVVSEIVLASGRARHRKVGPGVAGVGWTARGRRLVLLGSGDVVILGAGGRGRRRQVGGAPRGLAVRGERAWTVDALTGAVKAVRA